jgi:lysophospholipase L1-like esterase
MPSPVVNSFTQLIDTASISQIPTGTTSATVPFGNDSRIVGGLQASNGLSDVTYPPAARANLGIPSPVSWRSALLSISTRDPGAATDTRTFRMVFTLVKGCHYLRVTFANHYYSSGSANSETPNPSTITIKCALEYPMAAIGSSTGSNTIYPVYFNGSRTGTIPGGALLESDLIAIPDLPDGAVVGVRTLVGIPSYTTGNFYGISYPGDSTIGEGLNTTGDVVDNGTMSAGTSSSSLYGPCKMTGIVRSPVASVFVCGDSICVGTNDPTTLSKSGYIARGLNGNYPVVLGPKAGATIANDFSNNWKIARRMTLAVGCTHAIFNYGTNDLATIAGGTGTLAGLKTNIITATNIFTARGVRVRWCTILCKTTSSDGFRTVGNQTVTNQETNRLNLNAWLRDSSGSGYVQSCNNPSMVAVFDPASLLEVNSSGTVTLNGGFWPAAAADSVTGTATSGSTTTLTDSGKSWTTSQWANGQYMIYITSGTGSGQSAVITANTATQLTFAALGTAPDSTSHYAIYSPSTNDGTHPNSTYHALMASAITASGLTL